MGRPGNIRVFADYDSLSQAAAEYVINLARESVDRRGRFDWLLSGGKTPEGLYRLLGNPPYRGLTFWQSVHFFWGDERCVPPDDPASNFDLAWRRLLNNLAVPSENIHRMPAEADNLETSARDYQTRLPDRPDLILLGMGPDGHIASLFPHSSALNEAARKVVVVEGPIEPKRRLTITPAVLTSARQVLVLVSGADKASTVQRVFASQGSIEHTPARLVRERIWFMDSQAARTI